MYFQCKQLHISCHSVHTANILQTIYNFTLQTIADNQVHQSSKNKFSPQSMIPIPFAAVKYK